MIRKKLNKKAQEELTTDVFVLLLIVVFISISFFLVKIHYEKSAKEVLMVKLGQADLSRDLLTMLKTPVDMESNFGDLLIR